MSWVVDVCCDIVDWEWFTTEREAFWRTTARLFVFSMAPIVVCTFVARSRRGWSWIGRDSRLVSWVAARQAMTKKVLRIGELIVVKNCHSICADCVIYPLIFICVFFSPVIFQTLWPPPLRRDVGGPTITKRNKRHQYNPIKLRISTSMRKKKKTREGNLSVYFSFFYDVIFQCVLFPPSFYWIQESTVDKRRAEEFSSSFGGGGFYRSAARERNNERRTITSQ